VVVLPFAADACILASVRGEGGDAAAALHRRNAEWPAAGLCYRAGRIAGLG